MVECESVGNVTRIKNSEGDCVAQSPILIGILRQNLAGALLFGGKSSHDR